MRRRSAAMTPSWMEKDLPEVSPRPASPQVYRRVSRGDLRLLAKNSRNHDLAVAHSSTSVSESKPVVTKRKATKNAKCKVGSSSTKKRDRQALLDEIARNVATERDWSKDLGDWRPGDIEVIPSPTSNRRVEQSRDDVKIEFCEERRVVMDVEEERMDTTTLRDDIVPVNNVDDQHVQTDTSASTVPPDRFVRSQSDFDNAEEPKEEDENEEASAADVKMELQAVWNAIGLGICEDLPRVQDIVGFVDPKDIETDDLVMARLEIERALERRRPSAGGHAWPAECRSFLESDPTLLLKSSAGLPDQAGTSADIVNNLERASKPVARKKSSARRASESWGKKAKILREEGMDHPENGNRERMIHIQDQSALHEMQAVASDPDTGPLGFYWLVPGRVAGMAMPRLASQVDELRKRYGVSTFVCLTENLPPHLERRLRLAQSHLDPGRGMRRQPTKLADVWFGVEDPDVRVVHAPVKDYGVPSRKQMDFLMHEISGAVQQERVVGVFCCAGLGRTGVVLACYCLTARISPNGREAVTYVRRKSSGAISNERQERVVERYSVIVDHRLRRRGLY